jgi:HK97 family phage prohead protease
MHIETRADDTDEGRKVVQGYASTFNDPYLLYRDRDGWELWEQVDPSAFDKTDMTDVIMQYDHEGRVFARIRNNTLTVTPDDRGLFIEADLSGTEIGRNLYEEIAGGYTDRMSFGFSVAKDKREETTDDQGNVTVLRTIQEIGKLYDVSAVSLPANPDTAIYSARGIDGVIETVKAERLAAQELAEKRKALTERATAIGGK